MENFVEPESNSPDPTGQYLWGIFGNGFANANININKSEGGYIIGLAKHYSEVVFQIIMILLRWKDFVAQIMTTDENLR